MNWDEHLIKAGPHNPSIDDKLDAARHREQVEPWLSALFQTEHLNVLVGSGFTTAIAHAAEAPVVGMGPAELKSRYGNAVTQAALRSAKSLGRKTPNIEDQARTIIELIGGLGILAESGNPSNGADEFLQTTVELHKEWNTELDNALFSLLKKILMTERGIGAALAETAHQKSEQVRRLLGGFLLPFGS